MLKPITFLSIFMIALLAVSCKNDTPKDKNIDAEKPTTQIAPATPVKRAAKKDLTPEDIAELKSVMVRVMTEAKLKKFASYLVTAELTNKLTGEGPFTVFAPTNAALEAMGAEKTLFYSNTENRAKLVEMLKTHIVTRKVDKETLLQAIDKSGKVNLETLAGTTLTATKSGEDIVISDAKSGKASVLNNGVEASNGVMFMINGVLGTN
ncbi:fasciclin domain-containing protein [Aequorivita sp. F47161]|uniref:Fasciclin domain-containing protein n=1 Tax=Aequorivita vitellina TaxID=2874475 RepID=A0A9X1U2D7_9FLAO|nr:fasciclin domain-containing protein [Aequorivita vitellina]MCG2418142.1 fasciclin domain-containing protein [Aequorivita vitellina]